MFLYSISLTHRLNIHWLPVRAKDIHFFPIFKLSNCEIHSHIDSVLDKDVKLHPDQDRLIHHGGYRLCVRLNSFQVARKDSKHSIIDLELYHIYKIYKRLMHTRKKIRESAKKISTESWVWDSKMGSTMLWYLVIPVLLSGEYKEF